MKSAKPIFLYLTLPLTLLCTLVFLLRNKDVSPIFPEIFTGLLILIVLLLTIYFIVKNNNLKSKKEVEDFYIFLKQSLFPKTFGISNTENSQSLSDPTNALELMAINMREIKEYYILSKNMARSSFRLSVSMCLLGFILIASSIATVFITNAGLGSVLVPAIGGAIVEVVAGTSLFVYKQSLDQLNKYYEALHENERFLSLVNITDKISPDKKDDIYMEIIRSQLTQPKTKL
jgi:hypothetical protein